MAKLTRHRVVEQDEPMRMDGAPVAWLMVVIITMVLVGVMMGCLMMAWYLVF